MIATPASSFLDHMHVTLVVETPLERQYEWSLEPEFESCFQQLRAGASGLKSSCIKLLLGKITVSITQLL